MAELTLRPRGARGGPGARGADLRWVLVVGGAAALVIGYVLTVSVQAACAVTLVITVLALYQHNRTWGIAGLFALWFLAPLLRRLFGLMTGYVDQDPLSVAPFVATMAMVGLELLRLRLPDRVRKILLVAAAGMALGLPIGILHGPSSAIYAFIAYVAGVSGAVLGFTEPGSVERSALRKVLLFGLPPIAAYAFYQRSLHLPDWDRTWLQATQLTSIGDPEQGKIRAFGSLNSPGALAPLLALSLLCYLTVRRARPIVVAGAILIVVALSLTFVRSAWVALIAAGVAHVIASRGQSARVVFGSAAVVVVAAIALSPVSNTARDVVDRFRSINTSGDTSSEERSATVSETLPIALAAPLGHGMGSAGEASKLNVDSNLRAPDNGYLSLLYQVGLVGFALVIAPLALMLRAAWDGARSRAPGQDLRLLVFAMMVFLVVQLWAGDEFYGSHGVILWFLGGMALAFEHREGLRSRRVSRLPREAALPPRVPA